MEVICSLENVIVHSKEKNESLWCNRMDARLIPEKGEKLMETWHPRCMGLTYGFIGKMQLLPGGDWLLLLISDRQLVGYLPNAVEVYMITKVAVLSLSPNDENNIFLIDGELQSCPFHHQSTTDEQSSDRSVAQQKVQQTWNTIKNSANNMAAKSNISKDEKEKDKLERRLLEELVKMFNDSRSFYYSPNGDLTRSRQHINSYPSDSCDWRNTDDRFFWNKFMLTDLIGYDDPSAFQWILPIMQGYVQIERCFIDHLEDLNDATDGILEESEEEEEDWDIVDSGRVKYQTAENLKEDEYDIIVISRRSRYRAGTRYKRRGVDENGDVANYVETEQIVCVLNHIVSHVQLRGSVPVYWSQPGVKYRPLPQIDKEFSVIKEAFAKHFDNDLQRYNKEFIVSLVELGGREKIIADAFLDHILDYDSENLLFVIFDFHEYCRGMKFENVSILTNALNKYIHEMGLFWMDDSGIITHQESVFRINCMDCLDRTNVVQAAIAREVLQLTLRKLGRLLPDEPLPFTSRRVHNCIWANNGDAISRQYAGTAAMKGDFTRTGERKFAGVMKDGYNSASRYYLNRFKDNYRQTIIDMMLGNSIADDLSAIATSNKTSADEDVWTSDKEECITQLVRHSELTLIPPDEECLGGWALIDPFSFVTPTDTPQDEDVILMLTHRAYYVARYNDLLEEVFSYQRIPLEDLDKIEIGVESNHFKGKYIFMKLQYRHNKSSGYFHIMRTMQQRSMEESKGILLSIAEVFLSVSRSQGYNLKITEVRFDKRRTKAHLNIQPLSSKRTLSSSSRNKLLKSTENKESLSSPNNVDTNGKSMETKRSHSDSSLKLEDSLETPDDVFSTFHKRLSPSRNTAATLPSIGKSSSENCISKLHENEEGKTRSLTLRPANKFDTFFKKTKTAIGNVGPKLREITFVKDEEGSSGSNSNGRKSNFLKINVNGPLKNMLPEFRNKIQTALSSPRTRRKIRVLTAEEIKKRDLCKTKIIEL